MDWHYSHIAIKTHKNIDECGLYIKQGTLHGVRSERFQIGRHEKHTLGRLKKAVSKRQIGKHVYKRKKQIKRKDSKQTNQAKTDHETQNRNDDEATYI